MKRICEDFEIKNLKDCNDLYVQVNTLLFANIFENFLGIFPETHELDSTHFFPHKDYHSK